MASYELSEEAKADLIRIHQYKVLTFGEERADQYYFSFFERFETIAKSPYQYPEAGERQYRKSICGVDTIYYRIEGKTIEIVRILGRQNVNEEL